MIQVGVGQFFKRVGVIYCKNKSGVASETFYKRPITKDFINCKIKEVLKIRNLVLKQH